MEKVEQELLQAIVVENPDVHKVFVEHQKLEKQIQQFDRYLSYSSSVALKQKELKKEKLKRKEKLMSAIRDHRQKIDELN